MRKSSDIEQQPPCKSKTGQNQVSGRVRVLCFRCTTQRRYVNKTFNDLLITWNDIVVMRTELQDLVLKSL